MSRVIHFELTVDDPARRGLSTSRPWAGRPPSGAIKTTGWSPPANRALRVLTARSTTRRENWPALVNIIDVASLDEIVAAVNANGGKLLEGPMLIPGVGYLAYCEDTEGNVFGLMQEDPNAAVA